MIIYLAQSKLRERAKAAVRDQAFTGDNGVRGLPVRADGQPYLSIVQDVTVIYDLIDHADVLEWSGPELTVRSVHELPRHIRVQRPGHDDQADDTVQVMASRAGDRILEVAERASSPDCSTSLAVTCLSSDCGLIGDPHHSHPAVQTLAGIHDQVHHRGTPTAAAGLLRMVWEVEDPDGTPLIRTGDLELAHEWYLDAPVGAHLLPVMAEAGDPR